jgi:hypothetical protein
MMRIALVQFLRIPPVGAPFEKQKRDAHFNAELRILVKQQLDALRSISATLTREEATSTLMDIVACATLDEAERTGELPFNAIVPDAMPPLPEAESEPEPEDGGLELHVADGLRSLNDTKRSRSAPRMDFYKTPLAALVAILLELPARFRPSETNEVVIVDPFAGPGDNTMSFLRQLGYTLVESDIQTRNDFAPGVVQGRSFYDRNDDGTPWLPPLPPRRDGSPPRVDLFIVNPAFSTVNEFLARMQELNAHWVALMPLTTLESKKRVPYLEALQVDTYLVPNRINYTLTQDAELDQNKVKAKTSAPFNTSWFARLPGCEQKVHYISAVPTLDLEIDVDTIIDALKDPPHTHTVLELANTTARKFCPGYYVSPAGKLVADKSPAKRMRLNE